MDAALIWVLLVATQATIFGFISAGIWRSKDGDYGAGFLLGFVLSFLGLAYVAFASPRRPQGRRVCPHCRELMRAEGTICPHCHRESAAALPTPEPGEMSSTDLILLGGTTLAAMAVLLLVIASSPI